LLNLRQPFEEEAAPISVSDTSAAIVGKADRRTGAGLAGQDVVIVVVGQRLCAAHWVGRCHEPVKPIIGKVRGVIVRIGQARQQSVRRVSLLQQRRTLNGEIRDRALSAERVIAIARRPAHGVCYTRDAIEQIVRKARGIVVGVGRCGGFSRQRVGRACAPQNGAGDGLLALKHVPVRVVAVGRHQAVRRGRRGQAAGRVKGAGGDVCPRIGDGDGVAHRVIADRGELIEAARADIANDRSLVAKIVIAELGHDAQRVGRGENLAHAVVSKTPLRIEMRGAADIRNRRRQSSGRAVIAHRCDQAERVGDLCRLVVDRIVAIGRNQGSQRRARLRCPCDLGDIVVEIRGIGVANSTALRRRDQRHAITAVLNIGYLVAGTIIDADQPFSTVPKDV